MTVIAVAFAIAFAEAAAYILGVAALAALALGQVQPLRAAIRLARAIRSRP